MAAGGAAEERRLRCRSNNNLRLLSPVAILLSVASLVIPRKARSCAPQPRAAPSKWWSFKLPVAPSPRPARSCAHCKVTETPQWRSSLLEDEGMLCNACGLRMRDAHAVQQVMLEKARAKAKKLKAKKPKAKAKAKAKAAATTATEVVFEPATPQRQAEIQPVSGSLSPPGSPIWDEMLYQNVYLHRRSSPMAEAAPGVEKERPKWCMHCGAVSSPLWRRGPLGVSTLCNACGLRYKEGRLNEAYRPSTTRRGRSNKKNCDAQQQPPPPPAPPALQLREERKGKAPRRPPQPALLKLRTKRKGKEQHGPPQPAAAQPSAGDVMVVAQPHAGDDDMVLQHLADAALLMDESIPPLLLEGPAAPMVLDDDEPVTVIVIDD